MLPLDIILVRHGQSEGNAAIHRSRDGNHSDFSGAFLDRHSSSFRLTEKGRKQAAASAAWLRDQGLTTFDRYYVSEYARALETAALLDLPEARWYADFQLRERDRGVMDVMSDETQHGDEYAAYHRQRRIHLFYAPFPGGESMADVCDRLRTNIIATLHRECEGQRVIIVSHGDVMRMFRVIFERMTADEFHAIDSEDPAYFKIGNGQIIHYTRVDPADPTHVTPYLGWVRSVNPYDPPYAGHEWKAIARRSYTNAQLLEMASAHPRTIVE